MRCRGIELVVAVGVVLGWALPGCAPVKDVVATKAPLGGDAAAKDASVDAGGTGPSTDAGSTAQGDAGLDCPQCQQIVFIYATLISVLPECRVPDVSPTWQQLLFTVLDNTLGNPQPGGETRKLDRCDADSPGHYPHTYQDADGHLFLCPWYCAKASAWVDDHRSRFTACMPCYAPRL